MKFYFYVLITFIQAEIWKNCRDSKQFSQNKASNLKAVPLFSINFIILEVWNLSFFLKVTLRILLQDF